MGLLFLYVNSILGVTLVSLNEERKLTLVAGLALVLNLGPQPGPHPTLPTYRRSSHHRSDRRLYPGYLLAVMPRDLLARATLGVLAKAGAASAAMALVLIALRGQSLGLLLPVGAAVYASSGLGCAWFPRKISALSVWRWGGGRVAEPEETQLERRAGPPVCVT